MPLTKDKGNIERRMGELTEELESLTADEVDLDAVERRVQEMANAWGRMQMAVAMRRADSEASEVDIDGQRWGNRRVHAHDYETVFGPVPLERARRGVYVPSTNCSGSRFPPPPGGGSVNQGGPRKGRVDRPPAEPEGRQPARPLPADRGE
jgi:hypothetical protein